MLKIATAIRIIGLCVAGVALYQTFALEQSISQPDRWIINVTLEPLNIGLFVAAAFVFWLGSRLSNKRGNSKEERQSEVSGVSGQSDQHTD